VLGREETTTVKSTSESVKKGVREGNEIPEEWGEGNFGSQDFFYFAEHLGFSDREDSRNLSGEMISECQFRCSTLNFKVPGRKAGEGGGSFLSLDGGGRM